MKNVLKFLILVFLTASLTSCEGIKGWFDQEIDTSYDGQMTLMTDDIATKSAVEDDYKFDTQVTVHYLNDDLYEYDDKIQGFKTSDCTFEVLSMDSAGFDVTGVVIRANSEFRLYNDDNPGLTVTFPTDWPVEVGSKVILTEDAMDVLDDVLDDRQNFYIKAVGACNKGNLNIELRYGIEVTVIANPLD